MAGFNKKLFGGEIRFLRHELELSQVALSSLLGVSESTVIRWKNGKNHGNICNSEAERTLSLLYITNILGKSVASETLEHVANLDGHFIRLGEFSHCSDGVWLENITLPSNLQNHDVE